MRQYHGFLRSNRKLAPPDNMKYDRIMTDLDCFISLAQDALDMACDDADRNGYDHATFTQICMYHLLYRLIGDHEIPIHNETDFDLGHRTTRAQNDCVLRPYP